MVSLANVLSPVLAAVSVSSALERPQVVYDVSRSLGESAYRHYYNEIVRADFAADEAWRGLKTPDEIAARQRELRGKWLAAIGGLPARCPLNVRKTGEFAGDGYRIEKLVFESRPRHFVTAHLFLPDSPGFKPPYTGIVSPCGHSYSGKCAPWYQRPGVLAAKCGFAYLVYDPIDQGERYQAMIAADGKWSSTAEHNRLGKRAMLVGWNTAQFRLWDGMRAIDVLESRSDVKGPKYGVMGISGGGTLTSYIMAFDDRVGAACPAGFLSNMRSVCDNCGPQDAEQSVFGQLAFGFNHLGYVLLRAPSPVLLNATHQDFFPIGGSIETAERAKEVYRMLGAADRFGLFDVPGPHHWYESEKTAGFAWVRRWLSGDESSWPVDFAAVKRLDVGFEYAKVDCATTDFANLGMHVSEAGRVTPEGFVMKLPGARSTYDFVRDELARLDVGRGELPGPDEIRQMLRIPSDGGLAAAAADERKERMGSVTVRSATLVTAENLRIPTVAFLPDAPKGEPILMMTDSSRASLSNKVEEAVAAGSPVMVAELRGFGETGANLAKRQWGFYGCPDLDETLAAMCVWLGRSLVGDRVGDVIVAAKELSRLSGGGKVRIYAEGRAAVPAVHAKYVSGGLFSALSMERRPPSWRSVVADERQDCRFADLVFGALRHYDWTQLEQGQGR